MVGAAGMLYWLRTDNWRLPVVVLIFCTVAALLVSWRVAVKHVVYERA